jgi:hypothetical protein
VTVIPGAPGTGVVTGPGEEIVVAALPEPALPVLLARYTRATAQDIEDDTPEVFNYDTASIDTYGAVTTGAAWKFTCPIPGNFFVFPANRFAEAAGWDDGDKAIMFLYKNGAAYSVLDFKMIMTTATNQGVMLTGGDIAVSCQTGDYLQIVLHQVSGGTKSTAASADRNRVDIWFMGA